MKNSFIRVSSSVLLASFVAGLAACGGGAPEATDGGEGGGEETTEETASEAGGEGALSGDVLVDGSSTVFPISEAMAEEFQLENPDIRVTVGVSGSGGGFKKFCAGETDISNASRPIKQEEIDICSEAGIEFIEVPVAFDGLSIVVNPANEWAACMTAEELGKMWEPAAEGDISNWNQINPEFPDKPLALYGPGTDSGTYDYFIEAIVEEVTEDEGSRGDYTASEDDNIIVQGVSGDEGGLGFFGFAYYEENADALGVVNIENEAGDCVTPTAETVADGSYNPLSRPIFFYVKTSSYEEKPQVKAFVDYQLDPANEGLIIESGYVGLPDDISAKVAERVEAGTTGSIFGGGSSVGVALSDAL